MMPIYAGATKKPKWLRWDCQLCSDARERLVSRLSLGRRRYILVKPIHAYGHV